MLKDIAGLTKEELDKISKKIALDKDDTVSLSSNDWMEKDGIRYLKTPIKVHYLPWSIYTLDSLSLTSEHYDPEFLYVFAFSTEKNTNKVLSKVFRDASLREKGYRLYYGFQKEDLNAID